LIDAYFEADIGTDVVFTGAVLSASPDGPHDDARAAIGVKIGENVFGLTTKEARDIADFGEQALHNCPDDPFAEDTQNLILALRASADKSEQDFERQWWRKSQ